MTRTVRRTSLITSVVVSSFVIAAAGLRAEPPPPVQQGGVTVDFVATNASGQQVTDLKPADVSVKIGGKQRAVSSLEYRKVEGGGGAVASALPAPFAVNTGVGAGRNLLILIDIQSLKVGTERAIRESLDQVLSQFGPSDRVAFSVAPHDTMQLGFGAGLPAVRAAVAKFTGIRPADPTDTEKACRSRDTLLLLRSMIDAMAGAETPTSVLFIGAGLNVPSTASVSANSNRNQPSLSCEVTTEHYSTIAGAVANGRVNLFVAQGDDTSSGRDNGLENLAGVGGAGGVIRAVPGGLARVTAETSGYWLATVASDSSDRPGSVSKMELKVNREGVTTRARAEYAVSKAGPRASAKSMTPREMISSISPVTDLPLRAVAVLSRGLGGKLTVATMTETTDSGAKITALSAAIFPVGAQKAAFAATADDKALAGKPVLVSLAVDPGKYRVRVAATDANGRAGAVDFEVDANLTAAGPLKMGGMLLLAPRGDAGHAPQLIFSDEAEIVPYVELYFDPMTVKLKGAAIDVAASVDGPALATGTPGGQGTNEPDKFIINGKVPIAKLPPGDYVIRVIVQAEGAPEGKVTRTFRKIAK